MSDKRPTNVGIEVTSQSIQDELGAIKDRLSAIEIISSISNAPYVRKHIEDHLKTPQGKAIVGECAEPRTKSHLMSRFNFKSPQAIDYHLKPLMKDQLIRQRTEDDGTIVFELSNLFRSLPHSFITSIIKDANNPANGAVSGANEKRGKAARAKKTPG